MSLCESSQNNSPSAMSFLGVLSTPFYPMFSSLTYNTSDLSNACNWNQKKKNPVLLRSGMDSLADWLVRSQTQVMSLSSASTPVASGNCRRITIRLQVRASIKETCADMDRMAVVSSLFESVSKEKRDRDQNVVQTSRDKQNLHKVLERKAEWAVKEKNWLSWETL